MKPGPKPTPTEHLKLRGSWRGEKRPNEPQPGAGSPKCPDWLDDEARRCWAELVPKLELMGVLTEVDGNALTGYCRAWSRWVRAEQHLEMNGEVEDGKPSPYVVISRNLVAILQRYEAKFGLSPADRTGIAVDRPKEKVGVERFINTG